MKENCGIVILSGGSGRRMGYVNKADLDYHGRSFAGQIMEELSGLGLPFSCPREFTGIQPKFLITALQFWIFRSMDNRDTSVPWAASAPAF